MAFERGLEIEGRRLLPKHSRFISDIEDLESIGHTCFCCEGGFWRYLPKYSLRIKLDPRRRRFRYLRKQHPRLMQRLSQAVAKKSDRAGKSDDEWWLRMVQRYAP
jgi:hypothetical protein